MHGAELLTYDYAQVALWFYISQKDVGLVVGRSRLPSERRRPVVLTLIMRIIIVVYNRECEVI